MIIEFIGAPGAGKTTLLPTVVETLQKRGIVARTVVEAARFYAGCTLFGRIIGQIAPSRLQRPLLWRVFYYLSAYSRLKFFFKHPRLVWTVLKAQKQRPSAANLRRRRILYWFFHTIGYYEFLTTSARPDEAIIFDEGFIHRVVQFNASDVEKPQPEQVLAYVDQLPRPDLVIFIQASPQVCKERIYRRGIWEHFRSKSQEEIARYVVNANCVVKLAVDHAKAKGWEVIDIDNGNDDLAISKEELRSKLTDLDLDKNHQARLNGKWPNTR